MNTKKVKNLDLDQIKQDVAEAIHILHDNSKTPIQKAEAENRFADCVTELKNRELDYKAIVAEGYERVGLAVPKIYQPDEIKEVTEPENKVEEVYVEPEKVEEPVFIPEGLPVTERKKGKYEVEAMMIMKIYRLSGLPLMDFDKAFTEFMKIAGLDMAISGSDETTLKQKVQAWAGMMPFMVADIVAYRKEQDKLGKSVNRLINAENGINEILKNQLIPIL